MHWLNQWDHGFLQQLVICHIFWSIALVYYFAQVGNQFLLNYICDFSALNEAIIEHILLDGHSNLLG
jgi:hypothetical protein